MSNNYDRCFSTILKDKMVSCKNVSAVASSQQHHLSVSNHLFTVHGIRLADKGEWVKRGHWELWELSGWADGGDGYQRHSSSKVSMNTHAECVHHLPFTHWSSSSSSRGSNIISGIDLLKWTQKSTEPCSYIANQGMTVIVLPHRFGYILKPIFVSLFWTPIYTKKKFFPTQKLLEKGLQSGSI